MANKVIVFINRWEDRHGESGINIKVFGKPGKCLDYAKADVENYLRRFEAVTDDGLIDGNSIQEIDGQSVCDDTLSGVLHTLQKDKYLEINVDGDGTNSSWEIAEHDVIE